MLGVLRQLDDAELVAASDSVCTGLQLVNFLQDVPRDLELGRVYLPAEDRAPVRRSRARPAERRAARAAAFEADARGDAAARGRRSARRGSAAGSAARSALFARGGLAALDALEERELGRLHAAPEALARAARTRGRASSRSSENDEPRSTRRMPRSQRVTRARAKNFAYGIMLLPREKRRAIAAIYAFAREVDDVADGELAGRARSARRLEELRAALEASRAVRRDARRARRRAQAISDIPREALAALVDGGLQDTRAAALRDVRRAARLLRAASPARSASRASPSTAPTTPSARETLGIALQLINIMRDVREDWELGRVYLPQDELARFGVAEDDIANGRMTPAGGR